MDVFERPAEKYRGISKSAYSVEAMDRGWAKPVRDILHPKEERGTARWGEMSLGTLEARHGKGTAGSDRTVGRE